MADAFRKWLDNGPHPIDGGLATELERAGHDLHDRLWSARLLRDDPDAICAVHEAYFASGAELAISASYQASRRGFAELGLSPAESDDLLTRSITLARKAAIAQQGHRPLWVAASIGPYGAVLAGGEEYVGRYGLTAAELATFHRERLEVLAAAGPDLFAVETIPDLLEVRAIVGLLPEFGLPAWVSVSCRDDAHTTAGDQIEDVVAAVAGAAEVIAVGVNCTAPEHVSGLIERITNAAEEFDRSELGVVVYPNSGRVWDGDTGNWTGAGITTFPASTIQEWADAGATLIGGCCGLGPAAIAGITAALR